jgi:multidrug efflux system membrane fusion protein
MRTEIRWRPLTFGSAALISLCAASLLPLSPAHAAVSGVVNLTPASASASGIATAALPATRQSATLQATASVLDPQPLLALSVQLQTAQATAKAAAVSATAATVESRRTASLYRNGENASLQQVQAAAASAAQAQAQQSITAARALAARSGASAQWGPSLAALAAHGPQSLQPYLDGHIALLAVVLPSGSAAPGGDTIDLSLPDQGKLQAHLIGPSPHADAVVQGPTFFYRADGARLRVDQRLTATVPLGGEAHSGVTVPAAAVIWYAGQAWAYVETAAGQFQRRPLAQDARNTDGWFETRGFHAGERVVVRGGELLLSQELLPPPGAKPAAGDGDDG